MALRFDHHGTVLIAGYRSLYGDSEELIGKWFRRTGNRNKIFLATKFGFKKVPDITKPIIDSSAKYCKEACEKSLKALGVDYIDLCKLLTRVR